MTLNGRTACYCTNDASFGAPRGKLKEDRSILSAVQMLSRDSTFRRYKVRVDICAGSVANASDDRGMVRTGDFFLVISVAVSSQPLELKPVLLCGVGLMKYLVGFPVTLKIN